MPKPRPAAHDTGRARVLKKALPMNMERSQLASGQAQHWSDDPQTYRILYTGDSITRHGSNPETVARLKWNHIAGMAATSESRDYAHLLAAMIQQTLPGRKVDVLFAEKGGNGSVAGRLASIEAYKPARPKLVVIQLGEHEKQAAGVTALRANYDKLVTALATPSPPPLVLCTGVWDPYGGRIVNGQPNYEGWAATVDQVMQEVCQKHGIPFVPVVAAALDPSCRGWGQVAGVQWHPNDKGHQAYAQALFAAYEKACLPPAAPTAPPPSQP